MSQQTMSETVPLISGEPVSQKQSEAQARSYSTTSTMTTSSLSNSLSSSPASSLDDVPIRKSKSSTSMRRNSSSKSIQLSTSFKDWWSSSSQLSKQPTNISSTINNKPIQDAMLKNRTIEYELFRAMLSNDVYILPPDLTNCQYNPHGSDNSWKQDHHYVGQLLDVPINDDLTIHEFYLENNIPADQPVEETHIVMIHGYMAAVGYFIKNIETLLRSKPGVRLHLIDLPGFGNSSRPQFPSEYLLEPSTKAEKISQVLEVEDWFIDKIENWRSVRNISKFKLIGHSMGAYLSSCYLLKYNHGTEQFVDQFIIVSPMGTESSPNSLISNKKYEFSTHNVGGNPFKELDVFEDDDYINKLWTEMGQPKIPKSVFLETLWKYKKSPFQVLQYFGPFYSKILSYWSFRRFRNLKSIQKVDELEEEDEDVIDDKEPPIDRALILKLHNYSYSIFNQYTGSGELAITKLISHEILAKLPLGERGFIEYLVKNQVKTLWIYGDKDWMNENGGLYINDKVNESISKLSTHKIIKDAGHHIYLDNPVDFNKTAIEFFNLSN